MFRMWCKLFDDRGHLIKDTVIKNADSDLNRTRKIFAAIHDACYEFDLAEPIWLDSNVSEFQRHSKVRFTKDNFVEDIEFAYMEIEVIEEDRTGGLITALPLYLVLTLTFFPENAIPNFRISLIPSCFISESYLILSI